ncbi:hypothetical protein BGK67_01525 [Streptomyces subrutilus]|uniref:Uncharacterized protein n=1 Tax=Streptomyces subrutilus TaxID=36818 RepID=A0A1E5PL08_9ACTN|nr:hypothetical protein BGK67_01525 [Streptomyces subrutilus]
MRGECGLHDLSVRAGIAAAAAEDEGISRLWAVWNGPSSSGRSRQGVLVRHFHAMASSVRR